MNKKRVTICLILIAFFCLTFSYTAQAAMPQQQVEEWVEVDSFEEMITTLESMKTTGGNITLTNDIVVPPDFTYTFATPNLSISPIKIYTGEYSVIVQGKLILLPYLEIWGVGGQNGVFQIQDGGWLELFCITVKAQSGIAIKQAPRSVLCYGLLFDGMPEFICEGEITDIGPVAVPVSYSNPLFLQYIYVRDNETATAILPTTNSGDLYEKGKMTPDIPLNVAWDTDDFANKFSARESCMITGQYTDARTYLPPKCMVVFQNGREVSILGGFGRGGTDKQSLTAQILVLTENPEQLNRIEWSSDGENWQECEAILLESEGKRSHYALYPPEGLGYPIYISAVITKDGKEQYSNILTLKTPDKSGDVEGTRGGGTEPVDPKPPIIDNPQITNAPEVTTPMPTPTYIAPMPMPSPTPMPTYITTPTPMPMPTTTPTTITTPTLTPIPQPTLVDVDNDADTNEITKQTTENKAVLDINEEAKQSKNPVSEVLAKNEETKPNLEEDSVVQGEDNPSAVVDLPKEEQTTQWEYSLRELSQTIIGLAVCGVIIVVAVTWNKKSGWGSKLCEWFKKLIHK